MSVALWIATAIAAAIAAGLAGTLAGRHRRQRKLRQLLDLLGEDLEARIHHHARLVPTGVSRIELLDLRPGDVVIASIDDPSLTMQGVDHVRRTLEAQFPGHAIVIKTPQVSLDFARDQS